MKRATLDDLAKLVLQFREDRDWKQFHNPKDMALSLVLEAAELMEHVQWRSGPQLEKHLKEKREDVADELADVLGWVLLLANDLDINLADAFRRKMAKNIVKYPIDKAKGSSKKYTEF